MISNLKGIQLQGRKFSSYPVDFCFWTTENIRLSLVYGKNGSGKSTISDAFTFLKNTETEDFSCLSEITFDNHPLSEDDKKSIHIFNEKFIDSNIKIKENGIDYIVMFGEQVNIDKQIEKTEERQNAKKTEIDNQNNIVTSFLDESNANSPMYFLNQCISELKRDNGWAGKERVIKSARVNSSVTKTTVANIISQYKTEKELDIFIEMRINQLREEGAKEDIDLRPALKDYYDKHMADGTFVSWIAMDGDKIIGTSGMSFVEKPPYFGCPSGKMGLLSSMFTSNEYRRQGIA